MIFKLPRFFLGLQVTYEANHLKEDAKVLITNETMKMR